MNDIDVSIIMINYKNSELTSNAIDSILEKSSNFNYEIIVVDNSNDEEEFIKLNNLVGKKGICINSHKNLGFGNGNNLGIKYSKGKYLYFLNNDTLLINNAIYELFKFIDSHPNVGIVGSNLYSLDGKPNHSFEREFQNVKTYRKNINLFRQVKRHLFKKHDFNYTDKPLKLNGYVMGASLMVSKENFDKLGGFDKDIFMYAEETLLCYRVINELNLEIYNVPSSKIIHFEGMSFGKEEKTMTPWRAKELANGMCVYLTKAFGKEEAIKFLKLSIKNNKKMMFLAKLTKRRKPEGYQNSIKAAENKLKELTSNYNM